MDTPTPRVELLVSRLVSLNNDLAKNMNQLVKRLGYLEQSEPVILRAATENIIDRKKDKARHLKSWKVELNEIINTAVEFETLH
jgi:metal-responsive CopG/Arc/MetJ family transcriptional regulator